MTSIKCPDCGLVNWSTAEQCKRCGVFLQESEPEVSYADFQGSETESEPFFSVGLKVLTAIFALGMIALLLNRALNVLGGDLAKSIAAALIIGGLVLLVLARLWLIVRIFEQSVWYGLGTLCIPLVGLISVIKFWDKTRRSFVGQLICVGIILMGAAIVG